MPPLKIVQSTSNFTDLLFIWNLTTKKKSGSIALNFTFHGAFDAP